MFYLRRVYGKSMLPTLKQGNIVLAVKKRKYKINDIVIVKINDKEVIKRITKINNNLVFLEGDNINHSTDSRNYGLINTNNVIGAVRVII